MIVCGVDPGTSQTGYGIVHQEGSRLRAGPFGCIVTKSDQPLAIRLSCIHRELTKLLVSVRPDVVCVEQLFFAKNAKSAFAVGQARGTILLAAAQQHIPVADYTPLQVKDALVGYGRADKRQVRFMVQRLLGLKVPPDSDDAADALAIAICHAHGQALRAALRGTPIGASRRRGPRPALRNRLGSVIPARRRNGRGLPTRLAGMMSQVAGKRR